jgi:lysophospholipase L1-like esterase
MSNAPSLRGSPMHRKIFGLGVFGVALVVGLELLLWLGSTLIGSRSGTIDDSALVKIIVVGDSHAYGAMVTAQEALPRQLGDLLDEEAPGRFSVVNLGLPGMNTSQVRVRLARNVATHRPDLVIVWCGINNAWNRSAVDAQRGWTDRIDALVYHSRLIRFARVWLHNRTVRRETQQAMDVLGERPVVHLGGGRSLIYHTGEAEVVSHQTFESKPPPRVITRRAYQDFRNMAQWLNSAGIQMLMIQYPLSLRTAYSANRAMSLAAADMEGVTSIATSMILDRLSGSDKKWLGGTHPTAAMYHEIAREALPAVLELTADIH